MARLSAVLLLAAAAGCSPDPSTPTDEMQLCGGFGAIPCDPGFTCLDAPKDSCDPGKGDADCPGLCYGCDDPSLKRRYTSTSADECQRLDVQCDGNDPVFSDSCGCGCAEKERLPAG
jgi:hypothetical protein